LPNKNLSLKRIAVIGGGAAGFFAAIHAKRNKPDAEVIIFEKTAKVLQKVRISGGGRCNVTHHCKDTEKLLKHYPRGLELLKTAFQYFAVTDTIHWFEREGVRLKTEADGRMFPKSDSSEDIVKALTHAAQKAGVKVMLKNSIVSVNKLKNRFELSILNGTKQQFDKVIVTTGGHPKLESYNWLKQLGHNIIPPVPSLFTFNIPNNPLEGLTGVSTPQAQVALPAINFKSVGPILITHWGLSGPAVLKCSAFAAKWMNECGYHFSCEVDWLPTITPEVALNLIKEATAQHPKKNFNNLQIFDIPARLWLRICTICGIGERQKAAETGKKHHKSLIIQLKAMPLEVNGKTTFKEEFVTAGGVDCNEIYAHTMESKIVPGLFFAGEVLDIDGVTGGFNFQAAWTTGYLAGINC
jgi:predicted Rossmann fold flavoprotein